MTDSGSDRKRKRIVTRDLSKKVSSIHDAREEGFRPQESSTSEHNKMVQAAIISEIVNQPNSKVKTETAKVAVKRCYENQRRLYLEQQESKAEFNPNGGNTDLAGTENSLEDLLLLLLKKRRIHLLLYYVTEESDDPENPNGIVEHHLPWRSEKLNEFMQLLDKRLSQTQQHQPVGLVAKKVRRVGEPSSQPPPPGAPVWAVKKDVTLDTEKENTAPLSPSGEC